MLCKIAKVVTCSATAGIVAFYAVDVYNAKNTNKHLDEIKKYIEKIVNDLKKSK